jgi:hypothetical protein
MRPLNFDEDFDDRGQLRDGHRMRVPMRMADSADHGPSRVTDASGNAGAFHRPGFRFSDAVSRDVVEKAHDEYLEYVTNAWRSDADTDYGVTGFGESELRGLEIGGVCTVKGGNGKFGEEGSRGTVQLVDGRKVCVADDKRADAAIQDGREAAYQAYDADLQNAWRNQ